MFTVAICGETHTSGANAEVRADAAVRIAADSDTAHVFLKACRSADAPAGGGIAEEANAGAEVVVGVVSGQRDDGIEVHRAFDAGHVAAADDSFCGCEVIAIEVGSADAAEKFDIRAPFLSRNSGGECE
jgi:hypothetical protein